MKSQNNSYDSWNKKIMSRSLIDECKKENELKKYYKEIGKEINEQKKKCEKKYFTVLQKYFDSNNEGKNKINDLLKALFNFYIIRFIKNKDFTLSFREFINMFPRDTETNNLNRRQHIFEQMCRLLLAFNFEGNDKSFGGNKKILYDGLDSYKKGKKAISPNEILEKNINEGSSEGVIDIFIKITSKNISNMNEKEPSCMINYKKNKDENKDLFILIQNKYFDVEKSSADKYDVNKIAIRAQKMIEGIGNDANYEIVLMVNDKEKLSNKIKRAKHDDFSLVKIFGNEEIDIWFQHLLSTFRKFIYDNEFNVSNSDKLFIKYKKDILKIDENKIETRKQPIQLKFHQDLIVSLTEEFYNDKNIQQRDFIWGAVPRSGKTYMIGGLIDRRSSLENNILIVLGAKSETESQFKNMFEDYNFNDYQIVTQEQKNKIDPTRKSIIILSQEKIKINDFEKLKERFNPVFNEGSKLDLYFDEIHKGGSTEKAKNDIVNIFKVNNIDIQLFVMVTATYAKPNLAYSGKIGKNNMSQIFNWSYEHQQLMKEINKPEIEDEFRESINEGTDEQRKLKMKVLDNVFKKSELKLGPSYLNELENQYSIYPELVLIQPYIQTNKTLENIIGTKNEEKIENYNIYKELFMLKCTAVPETKDELENPDYIFQKKSGVEKLINFIGNIKTEEDKTLKVLDEESIYGIMKNRYKYDVTSTRHTELWFLPDKDLYLESERDKCRIRANKNIKTIKYDEQEVLQEETNIETNKKGLPNIEPLTRGLALLLSKNPFFKYNYNIAIVTKQSVDDYEITKKSYINKFYKEYSNISSFSGEKNLKEWIETQEREAFKYNKSLIILTGSMLRLGISIPCADIAFNMDSINSIDVNYQTMFRVLTERKGKKFGYYFDFYPDRAIKFLYNYSFVYGGGSRKKVGVELVQSLLPLFNYNGLGIIKGDSSEFMNNYKKLINGLKVNQEDYNKRVINSYLRDNVTTKLLSKLSENTLKDISKIFPFKNTGKEKPRKTDINIKPGKKKEEYDTYKKIEYAGDNKDENEEKTPVRIIAEYINDTTSLLAFFNKEYDNCDDLIKCLNKLLLSAKSKYELCNCQTINYDVLGCYIQKLEKLTKEQYILFLENLKKFYSNKNPEFNNIQNFQKEIFLNIKTKMTELDGGKKNGLIYTSTYENILDIITDYLPVKKTEKDKFGEVFTPPKLINEMFDQLPSSVWSNPNLKWLDPANGIGNFPMIAFSRLNEGLSKEIPDDKKRKEHIVKNMLYMVELNGKNVAVAKKVFGKDANIYCGSFLEDGWKKSFGIDAFDIIMGNPPFQKEQENTRKGGYGGRTIWNRFVDNSIDILAPKGLLCFINPSNWRGLGELHYLWDRLTSLQILYLHIYGKKAGQQMFNVGSRFDLYVIENTNNTKPTKVIEEMEKEHQIQMKDWPFLPNYDYTTFKKILTTEDKGIDVIYSRSLYGTDKDNMRDNNKSNFHHKVVHSIKQDGITYWYTNDKTKGHFGVPKVILNFNEQQYSHKEQNDYEGKYGMSQISFGLPIRSKKEGDEILKSIDTGVFKTMIAATKWGAFQTDYRMFRYFRPDWYNIVLDMEKKQPKKKRTLKVVDNIPSNKTRKRSSKTSSSRSSKFKSRSSKSRTKSSNMSKTKSSNRSKTNSKTRSKSKNTNKTGGKKRKITRRKYKK